VPAGTSTIWKPSSVRPPDIQAIPLYREKEGVCERALFVLDRNGVVFWSYLSPVAVNPGADGILDALERLPK
jgi:peroxiredoxin